MESEYDSSDNQELQQDNEDQITDTEGTNWKFWCRLCAKDRPDNICIYDAKSFASNVDIAIAIDKYFSSKIRIKEQQLPENLCRECYNFLKKLLDFEKRIEEVQELFAELISCNSSITETLPEDDENQELDCTDENDFLTNDIEQNPLEIIDETIEEACEEILEIEKITNDNVSSSKKFITILKCDSKDDYKCMHCPKVFKRRAFFESHLKAHENYEDTHKVVQCPQCDLKLLSTSLTAHIRKIHTDGHQYLCDECGKSCRTIHSLEEHKLIHTNYSPHVCSYCDSAFKKLSALNRHIQYVHDPNKYFCNVCNAEFKSNLTLKNHMITHSKTRPFKCDFCGYSFRHARNLKVHLIAHTGLKLYHCDICDRSYGSATTLRSHKKKLHPDELAAQEAMGAKRFGHSVPNIAYLKALTKNPNSLKPIVRRGVQNKMDNPS